MPFAVGLSSDVTTNFSEKETHPNPRTLYIPTPLKGPMILVMSMAVLHVGSCDLPRLITDKPDLAHIVMGLHRDYIVHWDR